MASIDKKIKELYLKILEGPEVPTRMFWKDGTPAKHKVALNQQIVIRPEDGFALVTSKKMPLKGPQLEMDWIWRDRSNIVEDLRSKGSHIWDEWELEDGTIGKSYGWIFDNVKYEVPFGAVSEKAMEAMNSNFLTKIKNDKDLCVKNGMISLNQVEYVIHKLIDDPYDKGIVTDLMQIDYLPEMSLRPCVFLTQWNVLDGKLYLTVNQRSADSFLGLPFNLSGYHSLLYLMANATGLEVGDYTHNIGNAHLYDRHYEPARVFIENQEYPAANLNIKKNLPFDNHKYGESYEILNYESAEKIPAEVSITKKELDRLNQKKTSD